MAVNPETLAADLLSLLLAPAATIRFLEAEIAAREARGVKVSESSQRWLARCKRLRNHLPADIEGVPDEVWHELERMIFAHDNDNVA